MASLLSTTPAMPGTLLGTPSLATIPNLTLPKKNTKPGQFVDPTTGLPIQTGIPGTNPTPNMNMTPQSTNADMELRARQRRQSQRGFLATLLAGIGPVGYNQSSGKTLLGE